MVQSNVYFPSLSKIGSYHLSRNTLIQYATNNSIQSYVGLTNSGSNGGIAYQPGVCGSLSYRTAVARTGSWTEMNTAEVRLGEVRVVKFRLG
jgi:hypothetical protein